MERNLCLDGIVINTRRFGEMNRIITLLTDEPGIIEVILYGGQKSRKAIKPPLFSKGTFYLFYNPVKSQYSLKDALLSSEINFAGASYKTILTASYFCELVNKTGKSDTAQFFPLLEESLIQLSNIEDSQQGLIKSNIILIQFVWKLLSIAGLATDLTFCPICNEEYNSKQILYFNNSIISPCCINCRDNYDLILPPGARKYLHLTYSLSFKDSLSIPLTFVTSNRIRKYMIRYTQIYTAENLKTVKSGLLE